MSERLPVGWVRVPLNQIAEVRLGRQRSPAKAKGDHMRPYMRAANVTWNGIRLDDVKEMDFSPKEFETYRLRDGDILLSEASGSATEVGKPALWRNQAEGVCFQNTLIRVRSRGPLPEYLHLHFLADARLGKFAAAGKGVGINHLGADRMTSWPIALPPLNEQRRIVAKLEALQVRSRRAREALDTVPALLEKLRQSILAAAFRGDLTRDWRAQHKDVEPASELLKRIRSERRRRWEESELAKLKAKGKPPTDDKWKAKYKEPDPVDTTGLPELPEGWCWASSGEICESIVPNRDKPESFTGDIPWVTLPCLGQSVLAELDGVPGLSLDEIATSRARVIPQNAVIMSCVGRFGLACLLPKNSVINQQLHAFIAPAGLLPEYLVFALRSQAHYMLAQSSATTIAYMNKDKCNSVPIALSSTAEQHEVTRRIERGFAVIASSDAGHAFVSTRLRNLEQTILAKAFRGELVPQDPNDEPADAMLARLARAGESGASA